MHHPLKITLRNLSIAIVLLLMLSSCRYSKPLISWIVDKRDTIDASTNSRYIDRQYYYLSLRKFAIIGSYLKGEKYTGQEKRSITGLLFDSLRNKYPL